MRYARPYRILTRKGASNEGHSVDDRGGLDSQKSLSSVFFTLGVMAIVRLAFKLQDGCNVIDLARAMSITERRMIHQKQVFTVMGGHLADGSLDSETGGDTPIKISTAPNNFYTRNAVTRGFRAWKKSRAKALEGAGDDGAKSMVAKYADFKVHLDFTSSSKHRLPIDASGTEISGGEWMYSQITPEDGNASQSLMIVGPHGSTRYGLAKGWLQTRNKPIQDPIHTDLDGDGMDDAKVDFINTMFQDSVEDSERLDKIAEYNNDQPYGVETLMTNLSAHSNDEPRNLQLQYFCNLNNDDLNVSIPGFQALCGMIRVDVGNDYSNPILILDVETKGWNF